MNVAWNSFVGACIVFVLIDSIGYMCECGQRCCCGYCCCYCCCYWIDCLPVYLSNIPVATELTQTNNSNPNKIPDRQTTTHNFSNNSSLIKLWIAIGSAQFNNTTRNWMSYLLHLKHNVIADGILIVGCNNIGEGNQQPHNNNNNQQKQSTLVNYSCKHCFTHKVLQVSGCMCVRIELAFCYCFNKAHLQIDEFPQLNRNGVRQTIGEQRQHLKQQQ